MGNARRSSTILEFTDKKFLHPQSHRERRVTLKSLDYQGVPT